ncbi:uncharacterized protein CPUR_08724 [Claviceps purpurea 20.1]|uniref:Uncharacterized protein n=1 Tax=Claviceps purpurea (strain 20.1) TaxID=1111077 RepID=M1WGR5_CLAP2|nr:uncharacterized protein CPUR_08724 [Claviceps purpurea 20.1]
MPYVDTCKALPLF